VYFGGFACPMFLYALTMNPSSRHQPADGTQNLSLWALLCRVRHGTCAVKVAFPR